MKSTLLNRMMLAVWFAIYLPASMALGIDQSEAHFELPPGLEDSVAFWEKIFSEYSPDECVFHDKDDLSLIYMVRLVPKSRPRSTRKLIQKHVIEIKAALLRFANGARPVTAVEREVYAAIPPEKRQAQFFYQAQNNIHTQRGVDLLPSLARSKQHLKMVKRVLHRGGLPVDLAYLPHLESGYHTRALSKAGARGIWQLMPATARGLGLRVSRSQDARIDPFMSTKGAVRILKDLHRQMGSWPLAITAYNYGPNGMLRAIKKHGPDYMRIRSNHQTRIFGFAVRNYYPSFLAARNVAMRYERQALGLADEALTTKEMSSLPPRLALDSSESSESESSAMPEQETSVSRNSSRGRFSF